jgi:hypothetical protein
MNAEKLADCKRRSDEAWEESQRLWIASHEAFAAAQEGQKRWYQAEREYMDVKSYVEQYSENI